MVYAQTRIHPGEKTNIILWDFEVQTDHLILARRPDIMIIKKKTENLQNSELYCPGIPLRKKIKETKKGDKYLNHVRELKKLCNMKVTVIPIVGGVLRMVLKGLGKGLEELKISRKNKTIPTTPLLR